MTNKAINNTAKTIVAVDMDVGDFSDSVTIPARINYDCSILSMVS